MMIQNNERLGIPQNTKTCTYMKVLIIIPAYNEDENLKTVDIDLKKNCPIYEAIVLNDGSTDDTSFVARDRGLYVIDLPINIGIGGAVQTGFMYAERMSYDIAVQFDGDGQHQASQIQALLEPILNGSADVVIGSRFLELMDNFRSTRLRRIGIKYFQYLIHILTGQNITDCTSGFRAYNKKVIRVLAAHYPEDYPEPETVITLAKHGFTIKEVPALMVERKQGKSSISGLKSVYYMIKVSVAIIGESIKSRKC